MVLCGREEHFPWDLMVVMRKAAKTYFLGVDGMEMGHRTGELDQQYLYDDAVRDRSGFSKKWANRAQNVAYYLRSYFSANPEAIHVCPDASE